MALGCAFIFVVILMLWRRHARKRRAKATALFASAKRLDRPRGWRGRLIRFGERLFGHRRTTAAPPPPLPLEKLRAAEEARYSRDMDKFLDAYDYSRAGSSRAPSVLPSLHDHGHYAAADRASLSNDSLYSHLTGLPRTGPPPRQPVRNARDLLPSRFSDTTSARSAPPPVPPPMLVDDDRPPTPAQEYARLVAQTSGQSEPRGAYWIQPMDTGGSRNPFVNRV